MFPEGSAYTDCSFGGRKDERFTEGKAAVRRGDCGRAAVCFEAAVHGVEGINRITWNSLAKENGPSMPSGQSCTAAWHYS